MRNGDGSKTLIMGAKKPKTNVWALDETGAIILRGSV
jgi:hypothetical protein